MDWKPWLSRWSEEWIRSADPAEVDPEVLRDQWLGFAPATEEAVAAAEARIGMPLPPSFREFLLTTDGWRDAGCFVLRMRDTSNLGWLRDIDPFWTEMEEMFEDEEDAEGEEARGLGEGNRFGRGLLISLEADAGALFLDPGDVDDSGEWAAYSHFSWKAEPPTRFASFTALMEDLYAEFHRMRQPEGETRDSWDAKVE
ncbi:MAG TPA: SMI1/KNR4 family protein [Actinoallomurus sp.]